MKTEIEQNKSKDRNVSRILNKAKKHQEKAGTGYSENHSFSETEIMKEVEEIKQSKDKKEKKNIFASIFNFKKKQEKPVPENLEEKTVEAEPLTTAEPVEETEPSSMTDTVQESIKEEDHPVVLPEPVIAEEMIEEVREEVKEEKKEKKNPFASLFKKKEKTPQNSDPLIETATEEAVSQIILENSSENSETDQKNKKNRKEKEPRPKGKTVTFVFAILTCIVLFIGICGVIGAFIFANKLCEDKPTLNVSDLVAPDSSTIYDNEGNKIMELGMYLRENIPYEEMPNCLIDAFLAIEDSRFFEHFGFDIPRFTSAALINLRTRDFSQGGSTVTMQLIKNTYYSRDADADSTIAAREGMSGIKRKMQEIVLALELELMTDTTKQEIIAMYVNKVNYGNNIRGVQKAAQYYFGKDAKNLSLTESAFLAGLINSPNSYNPYNNLYKEDNYYLDPDSDYLANAIERRDEVLDLMVMHGYISETEADLAKSVRIEDLLCGESDVFSEVNEKYQSYIDAVIDEVEETTGESPYTVGMKIHTNMNAYMQEYIYDMQNEEEYVGIVFPNELCQSAIVVMDNQIGSVEALGGGRGETDSARQFNRATSAYLNPGSSIKPVVDYALCIEALGYATSHTFTDMPYYLYGGNVLISNYDKTYHGDMLMTEALGRSQNTPAVQALAAVVEEKGEEFVVDYLNSIGFEFDYSDFDLQFAIGENRCLVTPLQLAGAHAMFINGGRYIKPHTINYIEYNDGRENFVADTKGKQLLSPATAWMVAYLEEYNMSGPFSSLMWYVGRGRDYPLYGKTGTTDWGDSGTEFGIPVGSTKDSWLVMQTNKYTISCWTGYDKLEKGAYFSYAEYQENTKSKIVAKILDELETHYTGEYDPYTPLEMPDTVEKFTHIKGAYPYAYPDGAHATVTGYISTKALEEHPLVSASTAYSYALENKKTISGGIANLNGIFNGSIVSIMFGTGAGENGPCSGESCDLSTTNLYGKTTYAAGPIWFPHWTAIYSGAAAPPYMYTVRLDTGEVITGASDVTAFDVPTSGGTKAQVCVSTSTSSSQACVTLTAAVE